MESSFRIALLVCLSGCVSYESMLDRVPRHFRSQAGLVERPTPLIQTQTHRKARDDPFGNQHQFIVYPPKEEREGSSKSPNYGLIAFVLAIIAIVLSFVRLLFDMVKTLVQIAVKAAAIDNAERKASGIRKKIKKEKKHSGSNKAKDKPTPSSDEEQSGLE